MREAPDFAELMLRRVASLTRRLTPRTRQALRVLEPEALEVIVREGQFG